MAKFITGKTYTTRSICDHECVFEYTVVKRTAKTVTVIGGTYSEEKRRGIKVFDGVETIFPEGTYSMCPVLKAKN